MSNGGINSSDKNSIIMSSVLVIMIAMAVAFFTLSRTMPFVYMIAIILALELIYVLPSLCDKYYQLFGAKAGAGKYIPYFNALMIFPKGAAILCAITPIIVAIIWYLAVGPMFWVSMNNIAFFSDVQDYALGWAIVATIAWSFIFGGSFIAVMKDVNAMRAEFFNASVPKTEFIYYVMVMLPLTRCFVLFNVLNSINFLLRSGYEYGKDYSEVKFEEDENDED